MFEKRISHPPFQAALLALALCGTAQAEDSPHLEQVFVTATRTEQPLAKVLAPVSVFEREDIERLQPTSVTDLLIRVPGVTATTNGGQGAATGLYMRGTNASHALVLIDGVRMESATLGQPALQFLRPNDIERIEVVRGPRAALYGSDAIGGVIQIFTRNGRSGAAPEIKVGVGTNGTREESLSFGANNGQSYGNVSLAHYYTEGFSRKDVTTSPDNDDDAYRNTSASLAFGHRFENGVSAGLSFQQSQGQSEYDSRSPVYSDFTLQNLNLHIQAPVTEWWNSTLQVGRFTDKSKDDSDEPGYLYGGEFNTRRQSGNWQNDFTLAKEQLLTAGLEYVRDEAESASIPSEDDNVDKRAVYLQYQGEFGPLGVVLGARHDDHESFGEKDTWSAELGYTLVEGLRLVASTGTAFKAPTLNDLYYRDDWGSHGNPDLRPEESRSMELALRGCELGVDSFGISVFRTEVEDLIEWETDAFYNSVPVNVDDARIRGVELEAAHAFGALQLSASVTYLDHEDRATGDRLSRRPDQFASLDADYVFGDFTVGATYSLQGDTVNYDWQGVGDEMGGYGTLTLRGTYQPVEWLKLALRVDNATEKHYRRITGYNAEDGLEAMFTVTFYPDSL